MADKNHLDTTLRNIPRPLWAKFRSLCTYDGVSANGKILELISQAVSEYEKDARLQYELNTQGRKD